MDDCCDTGGIKEGKRRMKAEECAPVQEHSHLQTAHHVIQQHIIPYKRRKQSFVAHLGNEGNNIASLIGTKRQRKGYATSVDDCDPYRISLFDGMPDKEKDGVEKKTGYSEILNWEKELICEHVDSIKAMFEFKHIYMFIHTKKKVLHFSDVPLYIVERMFLIPRESTHLASVMTGLLNRHFHLESYSPEAPMPYRLWNLYLKKKVAEWYDIVASFGSDTVAATNYIGFDYDFFVILGTINPLKSCDFHDLNLLQRVWLVKSLCDSLMFDDEASEEEKEETDDEDHRKVFDCSLLGTDRHGYCYFYLSHFKGQENLRVYRLHKYFSPVALSFYARIQCENHGQVSPCKKYHELLADDIPSLSRLASEFAETPETKEATSSQIQNFRDSTQPDCESELHQKLLTLLSEMKPLESELKSSTLKMLMLLKSDWDRYHVGLSAAAEDSINEQGNHENEDVENTLSERSDSSDDSHSSSRVQHFLVSMIKSKENVVHLKSIVPHLKNVHKCGDRDLPNVRITPLKKLNDGSKTGVDILTALESKNAHNGAKQFVVHNNKDNLKSGDTAEDSDTDDSVWIVESDETEDNVLHSTANAISKKSCGLTPLPNSASYSPAKTSNGKMDWETMSNDSTGSSEIQVDSSDSDEGIRGRIKNGFRSTHKPGWNASKQAFSCVSGAVETDKKLHPKGTTANKYQPLVIHVGSSNSVNAKGIQLSSCDRSRSESMLQDVQRSDGLPCVVDEQNITEDVPSQPEISALSARCISENSRRLSHICTARKSFPSSHRRSASVHVHENSSLGNRRKLFRRTSTCENISGRTDDPPFCSKFIAGTKNQTVKDIVSRSKAPTRILKATGTCMISDKGQNPTQVTQIMKFPIVSPHAKVSNVSAQLVISPKKIVSCYAATHLNHTPLSKSARLVVSRPSLTARKTMRHYNRTLTIPPPATTSSGILSYDNQRHSSVVLGDQCLKEMSKPLNVSSQKMSVKSSPVSQKLIYTVSPIKTSLTIRNSLEVCISATRDHLHICDNGKRLSPQKHTNLHYSDMLSSDILSGSNKKIKTDCKSSYITIPKIVNSCKSVLKAPSAVISYPTTTPVSCSSSSNLEVNLNISGKNGDLGKDATAKCSVASSTSGSTELIPVVLADGRTVQLRLVNSQSTSNKPSLPDSLSETSLTENAALQTAGTELTRKSTSCNGSLVPLGQPLSAVATEVSQISSSASLGDVSSLTDETNSRDSESNSEDGKFANEDLEVVQECASNSVIPFPTSLEKMGKRMTYAQKIQKILKSSGTTSNTVSVEKSSDVIEVRKTKPLKRILPLLPKTTCTLSVGMPKVKKVEIPIVASKILSNMPSEGTVPIETSSGMTPISLCNSLCISQAVPSNSSVTGFTGSVNQAMGNTLNTLNTSGGIIIFGQTQSGNNTVFTQPTSVNQTSLILVPSVVSTPCTQPLTPLTSFTSPLLSSPVNLGVNGIVSTSVPNSQSLMILYQNQLLMVPPVCTSSTLPVIMPVPPNSLNNPTSQHGAPIDEGSSLVSSTNCKNNMEVDDGWEVVPDPLELTKAEIQSPQNVSKNVKRNCTPKKKEGTVASSSGQLPEFPENREPPVLASNKKATEKYDLNLELRRPPLTLDEPIMVIPSRKKDTECNPGAK